MDRDPNPVNRSVISCPFARPADLPHALRVDCKAEW
jgi:hypothetical protein